MSKLIHLLLLLGLVLLGCSLWGSDDAALVRRVNLALRQTGHELLLAEQDSQSTVPPVQYLGEGRFLLPLSRPFEYDALPSLLAQALTGHGIGLPYEVEVQSCDGGLTLLGYRSSLPERESVPCVGREQAGTCANLLVYFDPEAFAAPSAKGLPWGWLGLALLLGVGIGYGLFRRRREMPAAPPVSAAPYQLGRYGFDPNHQQLYLGTTAASLTFRESKLLHYFARHPNQVLSRADISAAVWEDEGVMVSRSLDVFVSRLRKRLAQDPAVNLRNVHGVGYRLEVSDH